MRQSKADLMTAVIDAVFAVNGLVLSEGDQLSAPWGFTGAQWQVLGALEDGPETAAGIARRRGLRRQSVLEVLNRLSRNGMVERAANPADRRAPHFVLTARAHEALRGIDPERVKWAASLARPVSRDELECTLRTLAVLRDRLTDQSSNRGSR